jgi:hypothetical protein
MSTTEDSGVARVRWLALVSLLGPLTLLLPRVVVPIVCPEPYVDSWQRIALGLASPDGWLLLAWTTLPYVVVGWIGITPLWRLRDRPSGRGHQWGLVGSLSAVFAVGVITHAPQAGPGVNFGVVFFPFYAVPFALGGYAAGHALARICGDVASRGPA